MEGGAHTESSGDSIEFPGKIDESRFSMITNVFDGVSDSTKGLLQGVGLRNGDTDNGILKMIEDEQNGWKNFYNTYLGTNWRCFILLNGVISIGLLISVLIRLVRDSGPANMKMVEAAVLLIMIGVTQSIRAMNTEELANIEKLTTLQVVCLVATIAISGGYFYFKD